MVKFLEYLKRQEQFCCILQINHLLPQIMVYEKHRPFLYFILSFPNVQPDVIAGCLLFRVLPANTYSPALYLAPPYLKI